MESYNTIRIAILDDDPEFGEILSCAVKDAAMSRNLDAKIHIYTDTDRLDQVPAVYDLLFLDVELNGKNGIEWVAKWKKIRKFQEIIVVSSYDKYVFDSLSVRPLAFIRKTQMKEDLDKAMESLERSMDAEPTQIMLLDGQKQMFFDPDEIEYFKANAHYVDVILQGREPKIIRSTINSLQRQMEKYGFVRIQVSYLINMKFVERVDKKYIYLKDRSRKQISPKYKEHLFERLREYMIWDEENQNGVNDERF